MTFFVAVRLQTVGRTNSECEFAQSRSSRERIASTEDGTRETRQKNGLFYIQGHKTGMNPVLTFKIYKRVQSTTDISEEHNVLHAE